MRRTAYGWIRRHIPAQARQLLKGLPGMSRLAESARPQGEQWLPVRLGPNLHRRMLLPEAFHWISFEEYEPEGLAWVARHVVPGAICLDVGGHLGVYSLLLAELVGDSGHVCTFEPFGPSADLMAQTLEANGVADRVTIFRAAVADSDGGEAALFIGDSHSEVSLLSHESRPRSVRVPGVTLDAFAARSGLKRLDLMKMDIEGGEAAALRGGVEVLARFRPTILLEAHGAEGTQAVELLRRLGYSVEPLRAGLSVEDGQSIRQVIAISRVQTDPQSRQAAPA